MNKDLSKKIKTKKKYRFKERLAKLEELVLKKLNN